VILVTLGTVMEDPAVLAAILDSLAPLDGNVIAAPLAAPDPQTGRLTSRGCG
jgi:UDP:flavonoid glycosyltransferase YjiC (YdhE family)